jgi:septum formation protein
LEDPLPGESAKTLGERLAAAKAAAVYSQHPSDYVLGADTVVVVDNHILGKPLDVADAARMLRLLSGRSHLVITGVCLIGPAPAVKPIVQGSPMSWFEDVRSETTLVNMDELSESDIENYVASGEPMDKAGAYAIQGIASRWIGRIEGDYSNVVGLPVALVHRMLTAYAILKANGEVERS